MNHQTLKLVSPIPPSVNHYLSYRAIVRNGKPMAMSYKTKEATKYQQDFIKYVRKQVFAQGWRPQRDKNQHYYVDATFYFPRIDMDANNYWKCMFDAITETGLIWVDDNVACERVQKICYDPKNPRVELVIHPVDYIGVFDNTSQMDEFESICFGCTRYKRNCSVLNNAKHGRIQGEIIDGRCAKYAPANGNQGRNTDNGYKEEYCEDCGSCTGEYGYCGEQESV